MRFAPVRPLIVLVAALSVPGCGRDDPAPLRFRLLSADRTGIAFANTITPTEAHSFERDFFLYNGAGVAAGDIDDDGLVDLYFTGNMVSSRLYLNRGGMRFEDITASAGVGTDRWATGASMVDIDGDGDLDIYVSVAGPEWTLPAERANLLFVNNGDRTFTEAAAEFGIADTGFTTHAVFFDYDRDGHLDLFLLANSPGEFGRGQTGRPFFGPPSADPAGFDQLYRNNGDGSFTNVSEEAGIRRELGYGLGVVATDVNRDGWPDIYVSNDIAPSDALYINNGDGTFTDRSAEWLGHTSFAGMGLDIADFTNDGWPDILQVDMMPEDLVQRKRVSGSTTHGELARLTRGRAAQYNVNTLQLSQGLGQDGQVLFSEIARLAGVAYTDWSWSALFGDYDNDGHKDVFITTGYPKAVIDFDYQTANFAARRMADREASHERIRELLDSLHAYRVPNHVFRNNGDLTFTDRTREWGLDQPGFSYGAAHADLDNDGRLDLVVNNLNAPASVYRNVSSETDRSAYLLVRLEGEGPNARGLGARLIVTAGGQKQYADHTPYRGYLSTMDDRIHFGLGAAGRVDTLEVLWPDGRYQALTGIPANRLITVEQRLATAARQPDAAPARAADPLFQPVDAGAGLDHEHVMHAYRREDYGIQPLLPYQLSSQGPPLAVADVTGDGLEDVFVGGAAGAPGRLFVQREDGRFSESAHDQPWTADAEYDDWGALFFDADGDGLPDLYVASGGYHLPPRSRRLQDRLYLNRGGGRFVEAPGALPEMTTSTATVRAGDFTGDGRPDLFVGGRLTPGSYPEPTRSYVLRNEGGRFTDITAEAAPELLEPGGMVTDAVWMDFNDDGRLDLVTAGTWMPVRFFAGDGARLRDVTASTGLPSMRGWWYSLGAGDLDGDGDMDLVAGNLGLNHTYTTSAASRFGVYAADFDANRTTDIIFTQEIDGTEYPFYGLALLGNAIPPLTAAFPTFESFASASMRQIFGSLRGAVHYQADTFASVWLRNDGNGRFTSVELPTLAQISPIHAIVVEDVDDDGAVDLLVAGNTYETEPNTPRADAGKGLWLKGDGRGGFRPISPGESGFLAPLDVRDLALVRTPGGKVLLVANNGAPLQAFTVGAPR